MFECSTVFRYVPGCGVYRCFIYKVGRVAPAVYRDPPAVKSPFSMLCAVTSSELVHVVVVAVAAVAAVVAVVVAATRSRKPDPCVFVVLAVDNTHGVVMCTSLSSACVFVRRLLGMRVLAQSL